ncbi:MAG: MlaD family protein [Bryobacterales bacterium]|nr:MlaD family protein [Bryobacteraceae bacterium]MDW8354862.1 MlaD family protein [Bryobacterales bacterium]
MPSAKKIRWAQLKVGIMAIFAMVLLGVLILLLTGTKKLFVAKATLRTYMDDSAALAVGAPVRLNGIIIGNVTRVGLSGEKTPRRVVRIDMSVDAAMLSRIPVDSQAAISAENVLGTKFINIKMGQSAETVRDGAEIPSKDVSEFEEVVQSGYDVMVAARDLLRRIDGVVRDVEAGRGTIGKLLVDEELYKRLTSTAAEAEKVTRAVSSGQGTVGRLLYDDSLYNDLRSTVQRVDEIARNVQEGQGTAGKLLRDPSLYDEARKTVAELNRLVEDLNAGKGTAGKLLKDEELHRQIQTTLARLEDTVEKLNNGQGTLGQLVVNPQLYESLNGVSRELESLLKDFRANPKKFLRIKLALF